jgi:hypothetical protein
MEVTRARSVGSARRLRPRAVVVCLMAFAASLAAADGSAQDGRAAARALVDRWKDAIVNVRIVLKMRMSVGGREMQSTDETVEAVGTVVDPSGLTVLALSSLNPGAMMSRMMGSGGGSERVEIVSEPTDVRIRFSDGVELAASIALRDEDLNLAFIKPTKTPQKPLVALNLGDAAKPAILDQVVLLSRLGRVGGWSPSASFAEVNSIIERPRTLYVIGSTAGMGTPAFLPGGKVVGLLTMRQIDTGRQSMFAGMGGPEGLGLLPVILPAADVLEIAQQAMGKQP